MAIANLTKWISPDTVVKSQINRKQSIKPERHEIKTRDETKIGK